MEERRLYDTASEALYSSGAYPGCVSTPTDEFCAILAAWVWGIKCMCGWMCAEIDTQKLISGMPVLLDTCWVPSLVGWLLEIKSTVCAV